MNDWMRPGKADTFQFAFKSLGNLNKFILVSAFRFVSSIVSFINIINIIIFQAIIIIVFLLAVVVFVIHTIS